jgi:hypothetical protein
MRGCPRAALDKAAVPPVRKYFEYPDTDVSYGMDPGIAHEVNVHLHVDSRKLAAATSKALVRANQFTFGPAGFDSASLPSTVDRGISADR